MSEKSLGLEPFELDTRRKFVRVTGQRGDKFIEFDFAIGEPELFVEMILTPDAFAEFCEANQVEQMPAVTAQGEDTEDEQWDWRLADASQVRFKTE